MKNTNTSEQTIVFLSMIYITIFFASITVGYKIVAFGHELYCASVLIFPLLFPLSDAIAELHGPNIAKRMILYTAICEIVFVTLTNAAIRLPSPATWHHQAEYNFFVGGYVHILLANISAMVISFYLNVRLLNKWKILFKGKYFFLRSLGATAVGEISYTIITNLIAYFGVLTFAETFNVIVSDYLFKLIYSFFLAYPAALFVSHLKMKYGINNYSDDYNPYKNKNIRKIIDISNQMKSKLKYSNVIDADT